MSSAPNNIRSYFEREKIVLIRRPDVIPATYSIFSSKDEPEGRPLDRAPLCFLVFLFCCLDW